ncbi:hydrogenase maturation nickel metallochaperone HypA [Candidatus Bathyarchaeota archaeon]|nr:hydrogenase maturation nickel metallochaperone HypA [Candidatus Bathyarchaeota archaeon]
MHELSITSQIVESVLEEAKKQNARKVTLVQLIIGKMTFLGIDQIRFTYNILTENTIMKDSKLIIEEKEGVIKCPKCGYKGKIQEKDDPAYHIPVPSIKCPKCEKTARIVEGKGCIIKSIKMIIEE